MRNEVPTMNLTKKYVSLTEARVHQPIEHGRQLRSCLKLLGSLSVALLGVSVLPHSASALAESFPTKLVTISDFAYAGAFALPHQEIGESSANWAEGIIEVDGNSLFFVGHSQKNAVAEFSIPPLVNSQSISDLRYSEPRQAFTQLFTKVPGGNPEKLDRIVGLEVANGKLIANAIEYYNAAADNKLTTFAVEDASAMGNSQVSGFYSMKGKVRAAGWLSSVPPEWQQPLGCTHVSGNSSGTPIIARHSVGPSAFCVNLGELDNDSKKRKIKTQELLGFSLSRPLQNDLYNEQGNNNLWTHISRARYGFIIPGTSTYATFGSSGGHQSGAGYKLERSNDQQCPGPCSSDPADNYNYYWLWNVQDLLKVKNGKLAADEVKPYEAGIFNVPFQTAEYLNRIGGGSYDAKTGILYLSVLEANNTLGQYANPPVIVGYRIGGSR